MLYVLDTSVMLSDPRALERLGDKDLIIPLVVLTELESKRTHPELGYPARMALRLLESFRINGNITHPQLLDQGGTIRVEMNHIENSDLPEAFKGPENDNRILAVAHNLRKEGADVTLMTKDLPLRLRAAVLGLKAMDYIQEESVDAHWTGISTIEVTDADIDIMYEAGDIFLENSMDLPVNTGLFLDSPTRRTIARLHSDKKIRHVRLPDDFPIRAKNAEQSFALDLLSDENVGIVSLGGLAGSGKTVMALAAGVHAVKSGRSSCNKIQVFRSVTPVGNQELGFLPGTQDEKMAPWSMAVYDALESFMKLNEIRDLRIEILPLTHLRGRTLKNSYVIIDEAQNLDLMTLVTALSRIGEGSKVVLTHDVNQRDNMRVGKYDGVAKVISTLTDKSLFAHVSMRKSERSAIAELVASSFDL